MRISDWSSDVCSADLRRRVNLDAVEPGVLRPACTGDESVDRRKDVRVRQFARYDIRLLGFRPRGVIRFSERRSDGGRRDRWSAGQKRGLGNPAGRHELEGNRAGYARVWKRVGWGLCG